MYRGSFWTSLNLFEQVLTNLDKYELSWTSLNPFEQILKIFFPFWTSLMTLNQPLLATLSKSRTIWHQKKGYIEGWDWVGTALKKKRKSTTNKIVISKILHWSLNSQWKKICSIGIWTRDLLDAKPTCNPLHYGDFNTLLPTQL